MPKYQTTDLSWKYVFSSNRLKVLTSLKVISNWSFITMNVCLTLYNNDNLLWGGPEGGIFIYIWCTGTLHQIGQGVLQETLGIGGSYFSLTNPCSKGQFFFFFQILKNVFLWHHPYIQLPIFGKTWVMSLISTPLIKQNLSVQQPSFIFVWNQIDFPFCSAAQNGPAVCWQQHSGSRSNYKQTRIPANLFRLRTCF